MYKRISAWMFDAIILVTFIVGIAALLSLAFGYDAKMERMEEIYSECKEKYEEKYKVDLDLDGESYDKLSEKEKENYNKALDEANAEIKESVELRYLTDWMFSVALLIVIFSILIGFAALEFVVPLIFKNGQTLGKKIFGIAVMREDGVRITPMVLFVRSILGKYTIETMVPIFMVYLILFAGAGLFGTIALIMIFAFQLGLLIKTKTNSAIHDILSYTVTVDLASQMIFDTKDDLIAYKNKVHAEATDKQDY